MCARQSGLAWQMRSDVHYRALDHEHATSPMILNHRTGDSYPLIELVKQQIRRMHAENAPWLDFSNSIMAWKSP